MKQSFWQKTKGLFSKNSENLPEKRTISIDDLPAFEAYMNDYANFGGSDGFNGSKFFGGFDLNIDNTYLNYSLLRLKSAQLFNENLYARGLLRRLITNEINTGLQLEATPMEAVIGVPDESLNDWSEMVENRFLLWANNPLLCDFYRRESFAKIQRQARLEALICGDCLVILGISASTGLPNIQLIPGSCVMSPPLVSGEYAAKIIKDGIEEDANGIDVAYHVLQQDGKMYRVPAFGEKTGRRQAWMIYGTEKRTTEKRGMPLLSLILQSIKEIDRYRDSTQRKALINSMITTFIKKAENKPGTLPLTGVSLVKNTVDTSAGRTFSSAKLSPGIIIEELNQGEEPVPFSTAGTDINFSAFEAGILSAIAWANEIPPEILLLSFQSNYSASQAATNEFQMYLDKIRGEFSESFCQPVYVDWLISEVLSGKIDAPSFLDAWRNPKKYDIFRAWVWSDWTGAVKPSVGFEKMVKSYGFAVERGWLTNARASRELTGQKFSQNVKQLKRENELLIEALRPLADFKQEYGGQLPQPAMDQINAAINDAVTNALDEKNDLGD